jgi:hypothetical protein
MDETRSGEASPVSGEERKWSSGKHLDELAAAEDDAEDQGVRVLLEELIGLGLAGRVAITDDVQLRALPPLGDVVPLHGEDGPDCEADRPLSDESAIEKPGPRGGVVVDLARYRASRRPLGRRRHISRG